MNDILFGNNNRAAIKKLAKRNFASNRVRNVAAILAIVMTAFLFTSITSLAFGMQSSILLTQQMQKGSKADGDIRYLTQEQFTALAGSDFVERAGCRRFVGFATNAADHMVEIDYADAVQQDLTFCAPTHGSAPQAANEISTTDLALRALGVEPEVGARVPVEFELRGQTHRFDMVVSGWWEAPSSTVSLMIVSRAFMEENEALFLGTFASDREIAGTYFSDVVLKDKTDVQGQLKAFARSQGGNTEDINAAGYILCAENYVTTGAVQPVMAAAILCFVVLFVVCGYLLIYNIFDISVMQDVRQYGLLRTIGTSPRQIRKIVNRQAALLTLIGLPIGLLTGFGVSSLLLPAVMHVLSYDTKTATQISASPLIFVISALLTLLTVYLSTRKPIKKASRVSPIEAIRYTGQDEGGKAEIKRTRGAKLPRMALSHLSRQKRRSAFIIVSLLLCVVLVNSVAIVVQSLDEEKFIGRTTKTDFTVYNSACVNRATRFLRHADALDDGVVRYLQEQAAATGERYLYRNTLDDGGVTVDYGLGALNVIETVNEEGRTYRAYDNGARLAVSPEADYRPYGNVFGATEHFFDDLNLYAGETDREVLKQKLASGDYVILGIEANRLTGEPKAMPFDSQLQVGDQITFYKNGEPLKACTILALATVVSTEIETNAGTLGASKIGGDAPYLYLPETAFRHIYDQPTLLSYGFNAGEAKAQLSELLVDLTADNAAVSYTSTELLEQQLGSIRNIVLLVGGMIGVIFAMAGLINFTNMMITNIITRRHEFATMQSIGMTRRQLRRMMIWEGLYYGLGAGVLGCVTAAGLGLTVLDGLLNSSSLWYFTLRFTIAPALIVSLLYLVMAAVVPAAALHFFNTGTIVERLRITE